MPLRAFLAALVLGVFASQARATDVVGYGEAFNVLYSVDLTTRTASLIGGATLNGVPVNLYGLTFSPNGVLYAVSDANAVKSLLTIDKTTGQATLVGQLNLGTSAQLDLALAFTCDGKLWMSASTGQLWSVDPSTAATTALGNVGVTLTGLAARGSLLFGAGGQGNNNLYVIDPVKATANPVGAYGTGNYITTTSPAFDSTGQLWAILDYVPPPGGTTIAPWSDLAQLSPETGVLTDLGNITPPAPINTNSPTYQNLYQIGLKGLAIPSGICAATANLDSTPALSWRGIAALVVLTLLFGGTRLRRRRPSC